jgi:mRNA interferase RelE/StbE
VRYSIELTRSAVKDLRKIPEPFHDKIIQALQALGEEPRPAGSKKLRARSGLYRIRIGMYRVVYDVSDKIKLVLVERIADRKDVYK